MFESLGLSGSSILARSVAAALLTMVSGCAASATDEDSQPSESSESSEPVGTSADALTYPGGGLTGMGNFQIKNGSGDYCMTAVSNRPVTAPCTGAANQIAAIYKLPNGRYQICYPGTLQFKHYEYRNSYNYDSYSAMCLYKTGSDKKTLEFRRVPLSVNGWEKETSDVPVWDTKGAWMAHPFHHSIVHEANGVLGWEGYFTSGLKITRDGATNRVLLWSRLSNSSQAWTFIAK